MSRIIAYTRAYNSEKTLRRSVDSVLSQTHTDFIYYLLDNASCDDSGAIIREYAERDSRIVPLRNEINSVGNWIWDVIYGHSDDCYFCMLDADDEYTPDYFEKMLAFMQEKNLDVAACGSVLIEEETGRLIGDAYMSEQNLILADKDSYARLFNKYLDFMYTTWGKLYKLSVLRSMNMEQYPDISYGADTLIVTEAFRVAKRIGILAEPLHRYYISGKSISHNYDSTRVESTWAAVDAIENFLAEKAGNVSPASKEALHRLFFNNVKRAVLNIVKANVPAEQKLSDFLEILKHSRTAELVKWRNCPKEYLNFFLQLIKWVIDRREVQIHEKFSFLAGAIGLASLPAFDTAIASLLLKEPLLAGIKPEAAVFMSEAVAAVLRNDLIAAYNALSALMEDEIPDQFAEDFLLLVLRLAAKLEYTDDFIYFKKLQISMLIDAGRNEKAKHELSDWDEILPDDPDFKELKRRLGG